jgi:sec-independent protein translocase protein TatB
MRLELAMFDFSWTELLLIGIVALIAIGPKELPGALRTLGQWVAKVRRMASEFQNQFHEAMREAELAELKKEVDEMTSKAQSYAQFDPIEDIRKDIESAAGPTPVLDSPLSSTSAATEAAATDASTPLPAATAAAEQATADPVPAEVAQGAAPASGVTGTVEPTPEPVKPDAGRAA